MQLRLHTRADSLRAVGVITFLLVCYGFTTIVTSSKLFRPLREWLARRSPALGNWIRCPMCLGLWVGAGWAVLGLWPRTGLPVGLEHLAAGCASSGFCWVVHVVLHRLGEDEL